MHIILGVLSAVGAVIFLLWRISMAIQATREIADAAGEARGFFRRRKWRNRANSDQLKEIDDPREAATVMMVAIAESDGALTDRERLKIITIIMEKFNASRQVAEEFLARSRWLCRDAGDLNSFLNRLKPVIQKYCDDKQKMELIEMLMDVAGADGVRDTNIIESIARLKRNMI